MLIVIVYSEQFTNNAKSLRDAVKTKWSDASINMMGTPRTLYQVQIDNEVVYSKDSVTDNNSIIDLIEERV